VIVDVSRLLVYGLAFFAKDFAVLRQHGGLGLIAAASLAAFTGSFVGSRLVKSVTLKSLQQIVGVMLMVLAIALAAGLV
jgi:uncharacterized membrane protein YfcA